MNPIKAIWRQRGTRTRDYSLRPLQETAVDSLVVEHRTPRPEAWVRCPCHQISSEYTRIPCLNCGGGDLWCRRPFVNFTELIPTVPVWCSRPTIGVHLALAAMNFVGVDLTTLDRWNSKQQ
ncbi:hypothetical protein TNCV_2868571 [Trichonephila clavipes]|nr:hypothetical protein TNCV_2868571 [Trichonephila clavipes]